MCDMVIHRKKKKALQREQLQIEKAELLIGQQPTAKTNWELNQFYFINTYSLCLLLLDFTYKILLFSG